MVYGVQECRQQSYANRLSRQAMLTVVHTRDDGRLVEDVGKPQREVVDSRHNLVREPPETSFLGFKFLPPSLPSFSFLLKI